MIGEAYIPVKIRDLLSRSVTNHWNIYTGDGGQSLACRERRKHNLHVNERHPAIRRPENLSSDLMEVCRSQYFRTTGASVDQMSYDTAKESCTIWMAELANDATGSRRGRSSVTRTDRGTAGKVEEGEWVITSLLIRSLSQTHRELSESVPCSSSERTRLG
jgi:hypothetical protein